MTTKEEQFPVFCNNGTAFDQEVLSLVRKDLPEQGIVDEIASLYKVFGDSTRMRILFALTDKELCVYHIAESLEMTQSAISHQLRILRENKLVKARRDGKQMFYSLDDDHVGSIIKQGLEHILEGHEHTEQE